MLEAEFEYRPSYIRLFTIAAVRPFVTFLQNDKSGENFWLLGENESHAMVALGLLDAATGNKRLSYLAEVVGDCLGKTKNVAELAVAWPFVVSLMLAHVSFQ